MGSLQLPAHGSNANYLYKALDIAQPNNIIDFSVNTNPLGAPPEIKHHWQDWLEAVYDYPDPYCASLKEVIAGNENVEASQLLVGNGAAELITLIARYLRKKSVLIIQPAFSEYETACQHEQCKIDYYVTEASNWQINNQDLAAKLENKDAVFICQPNNPTGVQYDQATIAWLINYCNESQTLLIIDEAFYDFASDTPSAINKIDQFPFLLVLRSLTKMYNIAGLRLGFLAGQPKLLEEIASNKPHWSVNAIAIKAGIVCVNNDTHAKQTRTYIETERIRLFSFFKQHDFTCSPSVVNFYLLRDPSVSTQQALFTFLLEKGIVLRHTDNFPGLTGNWLRVAIKKESENEQLMEALLEWKQQR